MVVLWVRGINLHLSFLIITAMFDWNDEELKNIIWGDVGESDDHIVPYPEASEESSKRKDWSQVAGGNNYSEQKAPGAKTDIHGKEMEVDPSVNGTSSSGCGMNSWPNPSLSNGMKAEQGSFDTSLSNSLTEITKFDSSGGAQLQKQADVFQSTDEGKEQSDFVDYGWVGSFDDLDRIFSNDDSIFGNVSLDNADELWSSSKDVTSSPVKIFPLSIESPSLGLGDFSNTSEHFGSKAEYTRDGEWSFTLGYGIANELESHRLQSTESILNHAEYGGDETKHIVKEQTGATILGKNSIANSQITTQNSLAQNQLPNKAHKQTKSSKSRKKSEEKNQSKQYQDLYANWSTSGPSQYKSEFSPSAVQSSTSVLSQQRQVHGPESFHCHQTFVAPSAYGNIPSPYSAMSITPHIHSGELKHQPMLSSFKVPSGNAISVNRLAESPQKPQTMTPQEKVEKLRRRQQMQAMLAIQKQQQQLGQVSCTDQPLPQSQILHGEGGEVEVGDPGLLPSFEPTSPIEQDDSNTISAAVNDYSVEDKILYRLQEIVAKLDIRIRICIRDSLFRLAQSAMQRHYASETSSTNSCGRDEKTVKNETISHNRGAKIPELETETNPIDRTVAHLLFHRPMEISGNHSDTPESPVSTKLQHEQKSLGISKSSMGFLPEPVQDQQKCSHQGCQSDPANPLETTENISNNSPANDGVAREVETSQ